MITPSWFIITATPQAGEHLQSVSEALVSEGFSVANRGEVQAINEAILESRGISEDTPIASPSFTPNPDEIEANRPRIQHLLGNLTRPAVFPEPQYPLTIEDWAAVAEPTRVLCLTSGESLDPETEQGARNQFLLHRLATAAPRTLFFNVTGRSAAEIASGLAPALRDSSDPAECAVEFRGRFVIPSDSEPFTIQVESELNSSIVEKLEKLHRRRIEEAALRDRDWIFEKARRKLQN